MEGEAVERLGVVGGAFMPRLARNPAIRRQIAPLSLRNPPIRRRIALRTAPKPSDSPADRPPRLMLLWALRQVRLLAADANAITATTAEQTPPTIAASSAKVEWRTCAEYAPASVATVARASQTRPSRTSSARLPFRRGRRGRCNRCGERADRTRRAGCLRREVLVGV